MTKEQPPESEGSSVEQQEKKLAVAVIRKRNPVFMLSRSASLTCTETIDDIPVSLKYC